MSATQKEHCPTPATQKRRSPRDARATSDPLARHIAPRLPRKRGGDPRDARAYIRPLGNAHCPTPATQKRRRPKGRQGVHPTPWQCTLSHACHAKEAETQGTPGRTSDPLAMHIGPRLPGKRGGDPRDARAYIRPLGNAHFFPCLPRKRGGDPRDARACIRPLGNAHCPTPATQKRRRPKGRQGVHPTPWQCTLSHACHAKEAETQGTPGRTSDPLAMHIVPRLPRKRGGDPRDARAYIRPLGKAHCPTPATPKEAETQGTPGHTSDPLAMHIGPRLPRKRGGDPRDARAYIRPLGNAHFFPCLPRKRGGDPRDARAYIRPLGNAHCPTPATQKRRRPKGRQGVHPTPWQVHIVPRLPRKSDGDQPQGVHPTPRVSVRVSVRLSVCV